MKKILIVSNNLHIGGVQKALVNLLWNIRDKYDITLLLFNPEGEYKNDLPQEIKVIFPKSGYKYLAMSSADIRGWKDKIWRTFYAGLSRVFGRKYAIALMGLGQKQLLGYDAAISYLHNSGCKAFYGGCNDFVLKHVSAKKKITFLHCDYLRSGADTADNAKQYACFDAIAACSHGCAEAFLKANPTLRDKVVVVPNCQRIEIIKEAAEQASAKLSADKINLLTVARFGKEKGVERALRVISKLGPLKEKIHYYIVGDGIQKALMLSIIERENLQNCVTLCGMLENPYGYIKAADMLLIPSYSEAAPLVIGEAACLGTPILSMETSSACEMIETPGYGWVCENSEDAMWDMLASLLREPAKISAMKNNVDSRVIDNLQAVEAFESCLSL